MTGEFEAELRRDVRSIFKIVSRLDKTLAVVVEKVNHAVTQPEMMEYFDGKINCVIMQHNESCPSRHKRSKKDSDTAIKIPEQPKRCIITRAASFDFLKFAKVALIAGLFIGAAFGGYSYASSNNAQSAQADKVDTNKK